jgi:hypothetical protein
MKRQWSALVALTLLAGCSAPAEPAPKPVLCTSGQLTFGTASVAALLTGVTPVHEATAKGMTFDHLYAEINTRTAGVRAGAEVPAEDVYRQLAAKYAQKRLLVEYGTVHRQPTGESSTFDGTGRFVSYDWIRTVDAPFSYTCNGTTSQGAVISWEAVGRGGLLNCDEPDVDASDDDVAMMRHVRTLRCNGD